MRPTSPSRRLAIDRGADGPVRLFVDSGAWIALRSQRDQHHAEADHLFREALRRRLPLVTTPLVIAEVHRLTLFRVGVQAALRGLDRIDASPSVTMRFADVEDHRAARRWLERLAPRPITYTDAVSFAVMEATRCRHVLGFDEDFVAAGYSLWRERP
jgi:predicted nucleic acid-binding protein